MLKKFRMNYFNPRKTPFLLGVKLEEPNSTPLVKNTLYKQLVGCLLMRSKGLFRVAMENEVDPNTALEKIKWHNKRDEAYGLLCLSISRDLVFRVNGLTSPNEVWEKLQTLFGNGI